EISLAFGQSGNRRVKWGTRPKPESFIAEEGKSLVLDHRPANRGSKLVLGEWGRLVRGRRSRVDFRVLVEKLVGVENLIPEVLIPSTMPAIGSGFRAHVDDAAGKLAPLRTKVIVLHL